MAAQMLEAACHDAHADDQDTEPVVTALGSGGRYYICTKTRSNEYKQHFHDLPKALEEWLFPPDGSSRDLETLQVILIGDDGFWASDKNGELRSHSERPSQRLKRPMTWHGQQQSQRRSVSSTNTSTSKGSQGRERSLDAAPQSSRHGRSNSGESTGDSLADQEPTSPRGRNEVPVPKAKPAPQTMPKPVPAPLSMRASQSMPPSQHPIPPSQPPAASRSRTSTVSGNLWPRPLPDERRVEVLRREALKRRRSRLSVDEGSSNPIMPPLPLAIMTAAPPPAPRYADAGVQTDSSAAKPKPPPSPPATASFNKAPACPCRCRSQSVSCSPHSRSTSSTTSSSRSSTIYVAGSDAFAWPPVPTKHLWPRKASNPVAMGQLQEYFRSHSYTLGDALERVGMG